MSAAAVTPAASADAMLPVPYRVVDRTVETHDSATLRLSPVGRRLPHPNAGQFCMLYARGIGEIAISISDASEGTLVHTIRDVGAVSRALAAARPDALLGVRGPFGTDWGLDSAVGHDAVIVAGGVGLAPLRPVVLGALRRRAEYGRVVLIAGARSAGEFLFRAQLAEWVARPDIDLELIVDSPAADWDGPVGFVTEPLGRLDVDPAATIAFICGPEPMMRFSANVLLDKGVAADRIRVSLERNMQCGIGVCGHCQLGPLLVCRDGPVVDYVTAEPLLAAREL